MFGRKQEIARLRDEVTVLKLRPNNEVALMAAYAKGLQEGISHASGETVVQIGEQVLRCSGKVTIQIRLEDQ